MTFKSNREKIIEKLKSENKITELRLEDGQSISAEVTAEMEAFELENQRKAEESLIAISKVTLNA